MLAFDSAGNLYAVNHGYFIFGTQYANTIEKFSPTGLDLGIIATSGQGLNQPRGVAFDAMGNLFVSNSGNNTIEAFTPDGDWWVFAHTGLANPQGLAFDDAGNLYVANVGNSTIISLTRMETARSSPPA